MDSGLFAMRSLSIRTRLILMCGGLALFTGIVGGLGIWAFSTLNQAFQVAVDQSLPAVDELLQTERDMQQVAVAERSLMFMNITTPAAQEQLRMHGEKLRQVKERWKRYTAIPAGESERKLWLAFETARNEWEEASREVVKILNQDSPAARRDAIDLSMGDGQAKFETARKTLADLSEIRLSEAKTHASGEEAHATHMQWWVVVSIAVAFTLALGVSFALARSIAKPLGETVALLKDIAEGEGDLTRRLEVKRQDEVGELARWFNVFMDKLHDIIGQTKGTAVHVASASHQLWAATEKLSGGAQEQVSSLEETAASLEELSGTVKQNADNAKQANQLAMGSRDTAEKGGQVVTTAVAAMSEINRSSKKIAEIITVIDEIAFQTNLLALNAAVEAARAGDQGRGFAVVAAEVRNLAQRSAAAAKEIKALIQDSVQKVQDGSEFVNQSGQKLQEIVASVKRVADIIAEIAAASQEQSQGIMQVNKAVAQMEQVTQANSAQTEELSSTAQSLAAQAQQLQSLVGRFKMQADAEALSGVAAGLSPSARPPRKAAAMAKKAEPVLIGAPRRNGPGAEDDGFDEF